MRLTKINIFLFSFLLLSCNDTGKAEKKISRVALVSSLDSSALNKLAANYKQGKLLFKQYCSACHFDPETRFGDGLVFDNLFERLPSPPEDYFIKFIQNSKLLKSSGDKYSQQLSKVWNSDFEHYFKDDLMQQDFNDLIVYLKVATKQKNK